MTSQARGTPFLTTTDTSTRSLGLSALLSPTQRTAQPQGGACWRAQPPGLCPQPWDPQEPEVSLQPDLPVLPPGAADRSRAYEPGGHTPWQKGCAPNCADHRTGTGPLNVRRTFAGPASGPEEWDVWGAASRWAVQAPSGGVGPWGAAGTCQGGWSGLPQPHSRAGPIRGCCAKEVLL